MEIYGRKIGLLFSVGAKYEIGSLDKGLDNMMRTVQTAVIMSRAYEKAQKFKDPAHVERPLTKDEVMTLSDEEFAHLCDELTVAFEYGNNVTVEVESKKKEEEAPSSTTAGVSTTDGKSE